MSQEAEPTPDSVNNTVAIEQSLNQAKNSNQAFLDLLEPDKLETPKPIPSNNSSPLNQTTSLPITEIKPTTLNISKEAVAVNSTVANRTQNISKTDTVTLNVSKPDPIPPPPITGLEEYILNKQQDQPPPPASIDSYID